MFIESVFKILGLKFYVAMHARLKEIQLFLEHLIYTFLDHVNLDKYEHTY